MTPKVSAPYNPTPSVRVAPMVTAPTHHRVDSDVGRGADHLAPPAIWPTANKGSLDGAMYTNSQPSWEGGGVWGHDDK